MVQSLNYPRQYTTPNDPIVDPQSAVPKASLTVITPKEAPKRILQINGRADLSGGPIYMLELLQHLDARKYEHIVLCPPEKKGIIEKLEGFSNCRVVPMNIRSFSLFNLLTILKLIRNEKIDLIHSHGKAAGIYSRIVGHVASIPVIHHLHGIHYRQYPPFLQKCYFYLEKFLSRGTKRIICVSESEHQEGLSAKMFSPSQTIVVPNGVNVDRFHPSKHLAAALKRKWSIPENAKIITSITRYCYQKNIPLTLQVHQKICEQYPDTWLILIGISDSNFHVKRTLDSLPTKAQVVLVEHETEINKLLNISDVYLNTSRWEGLSLGVIEAMALEIPVVLSDVVGNRDIYNGKHRAAFLVKGEEENNFVNAIHKIFQDSNFAKETGKQLRKQVKHQFTLLGNTQAVEKEYQLCINEKT